MAKPVPPAPPRSKLRDVPPPPPPPRSRFRDVPAPAGPPPSRFRDVPDPPPLPRSKLRDVPQPTGAAPAPAARKPAAGRATMTMQTVVASRRADRPDPKDPAGADAGWKNRPMDVEAVLPGPVSANRRSAAAVKMKPLPVVPVPTTRPMAKMPAMKPARFTDSTAVENEAWGVPPPKAGKGKKP